MYRVKVRTVGDGQHPSEAVVSVTTADGRQERLIVDKSNSGMDERIYRLKAVQTCCTGRGKEFSF